MVVENRIHGPDLNALQLRKLMGKFIDIADAKIDAGDFDEAAELMVMAWYAADEEADQDAVRVRILSNPQLMAAVLAHNGFGEQEHFNQALAGIRELALSMSAEKK